MRQIYLILFSLVYFFPFVEAREITIDDIHDKTLVSKDSISMRKFMDEDHLLQKDDLEDDQWELHAYDPKYMDLRLTLVQSSVVLSKLNQLSGMENKTFKDIANFSISSSGYLLFHMSKDYFVYDVNKEEIKRLTNSPYEKVGEEFSPDGKFLAYIENYNLWVVDVETAVSRQITFDGNERLLYGRLDWVYQEEIYGRGNYKGYWWSPDSQKIAFLKIDESPVKIFPIVNTMEDYGALYSMSYPKAGRPNPVVELGVVDAGGSDIEWVDLSEYELDQYLIVGVTFSPDSKGVIYQVQNRTQNWLHLNLYSLGSGDSKRIMEQKRDTWIDRLQERPTWGLDKKSLFFLNDESGYSHIYAYFDWNGKDAQTKLTKGKFDVKEILGMTYKWIYFSTNKDSLLRDQIYGLDLKEFKIHRMTDTKFHHSAKFSKNGKYALITSQSQQQAPKVDLYEVNGKKLVLIKNLFTPNTEKLEELDRSPVEYITFKNSKGQELQAFMIKPNDFDPKKKYKVLSYVYSGPKIPSILDRFNVSFQLWHQFMAQKGYVIWAVDSYIANSYGHEGAAGCYQQLGKLELEDLEDGIKYLTDTYSWVDQDRVGLWGWSYGGYMTSYALTHSKTFKAGAAVAPLLDFKLYDSVYTERYMNTPQANKEGYRCSSVLECAKDLSGDYLLIHGTQDDNVHLQNTLQMVNELTKNRKQFQFMLYPENEHSIRERREHLFDTLTKFFDEKL